MKRKDNGVLLRDCGDGRSLLCNAFDDRAIVLNSLGTFIWEQLASEISEDELVGSLSARYPEVSTDKLRDDLRLFLGKLKHIGFVDGYDGSSLTPNNSEALLQDGYAMYKGQSMRGVFIPGDSLKIGNIEYKQIKVGDIVAFKVRDGRTFVHRVIARKGNRLVTMGDANPGPDAGYVLAEDNPQIVVERRLPDGRVCRVSNGWRGMMLFRWNRFVYQFRRLRRKLATIVKNRN